MIVSRLLPLPLALLAAMPFVAHADELDTLQFKVGQTIERESNIFRTPNAQSDTIGVTTLGVKFDKSYSLQRIELEADINRYRYNNFSNLNFTAVNYAAAWRFSLTPRFRGNLTTDRREYVDTADQAFGEVNRRTNRNTLLDAEYEVGAAWRLVGGVFDRRTENSEPAFTSESSSTVTGAEAGVRYVTAAGNSLAYRLRNGNGEYEEDAVLSGRNFKDLEHEFRVEYAPTAKTTVRARFSYLDREHESLPERDFSGVVGRVDANWAITGKTSLGGGFARELGSYQTGTDNYYSGHRIFVTPVWKPTEKTAVRLRYDRATRNYKGAPAGGTPSGRRDTIQLASIGAEWEVIRAITLTAGLQREKRSSNVGAFNYTNNSVIIGAVARF